MSDQPITATVTVWIAAEKHGARLYGTALEIVRERLNYGEYYNWDEGDPERQYADRANVIVAARDERAAESFLHERSEFEYESVEEQEVNVCLT